jgi:hypothetical protein
VGAVLTIAYAVVQPLTSPPTKWQGMAAYSASFNPVSLTWVYPALLLAPAFVVAMVSLHRAMPEERRLWTQLGVVFACLYAPIQTLNYVIQVLAVAPSIQAGETEGLAFFAFTNPHGFFTALETFGYVFMLLALLFSAPAFQGGGLQRWLRWTFAATFGIVIALAAIGVALGLSLVWIGAITTDAWEVLYAFPWHSWRCSSDAGRGLRGDGPSRMEIELEVLPHS